MSENEMTPAWAIELMIKFERLDAKITSAEERNGGHQTWAERNIKDHETRLRMVEQHATELASAKTDIETLKQFRWMVVGLVSVSGIAGALISKLLGI